MKYAVVAVLRGIVLCGAFGLAALSGALLTVGAWPHALGAMMFAALLLVWYDETR